MSALGQKQACAVHQSMSAFGPTADVTLANWSSRQNRPSQVLRPLWGGPLNSLFTAASLNRAFLDTSAISSE